MNDARMAAGWTWLKATVAGNVLAVVGRAVTRVEAREIEPAHIVVASAVGALGAVIASRWMKRRGQAVSRWLPVLALGVATAMSAGLIVHPPSPRLGAVANPIHFAVALVIVLSVIGELPARAAAIVFAVALVLGAGTALAAGATSAIAIGTAPRPVPLARSSEQARAAIDAFWKAFHANRYEALDEVIAQLDAALTATPQDPEIARALGEAHLWKGAEQARVDPRPPIEQLMLAERHFDRAHALAPSSAHVLSFAGATKMAVGGLTGDMALARTGYFMVKDAMSVEERFNLEGLAGMMAGLPAESPQFQEGLHGILSNYEACAGQTVDRSTVTEAQLDALTPRVLAAVATSPFCGNNEIAPHHIEGLTLQAGDLLAKSGQPAAARAMYRHARHVPGYETWPYRRQIEDRLAHVEERAGAFADRSQPQPEIFARSAYSCTGCHAR